MYEVCKMYVVHVHGMPKYTYDSPHLESYVLWATQNPSLWFSDWSIHLKLGQSRAPQSAQQQPILGK